MRCLVMTSAHSAPVCVTASEGTPDRRPVHGAGLVLLCVWLGPFAVAAVAFMLAYVAMGIATALPRRITRPMVKDLREVYKRDA
jgi:hypothetical protein